jgi:hypothetical protein
MPLSHVWRLHSSHLYKKFSGTFLAPAAKILEEKAISTHQISGWESPMTVWKLRRTWESIHDSTAVQPAAQLQSTVLLQ